MQLITGAFEALSQADIRKPAVGLNISWRRIKDENIDFAIVGTSVVNGLDIVQGELDFITSADLFEYFDESDNLVSLSIDQEIIEPLGGISYARANIVLSNTEDRYTTGADRTIGQFISRNRPAKVFLGFENNNGTKLMLPAVYGISKDVEKDDTKKLVKVSLFDYLSFIDGFELSAQVFTNMRTDEIIADILLEMGFVAEQSSLDVGYNTVGFCWVSKGTKAGNLIKQLCQSEGAVFSQNELGEIFFRTHDNLETIHFVKIVGEDVIAKEEKLSEKIYNYVTVRARPRVVLAEQVVYTSDNAIEVATGVSSFFISLDNPLSTLSTPLSGTNWVANSARDGSGSNETSDVAITYTNFVDTVKVNVNNTSGAIAYLTTLTIEGEPAVIEKIIEEVAEDVASQDEFGTIPLLVENDFITDSNWASTYAQNIVDQYKPSNKELKLTIPAKPQFMLGDKIRYIAKNPIVDYDFRNYYYLSFFENNFSQQAPIINGGRIIFTASTTGSSDFSEVRTSEYFSLINKTISVKIKSIGTTTNNGFYIYVAKDYTDNYITFYVYNGSVFIEGFNNGEFLSFDYIEDTASSIKDLWIRFAELDGMLYYQTSSDGVVYETITIVQTPTWLYESNNVMSMGAESWGAVSGTTQSFIVEHFTYEISDFENLLEMNSVIYDTSTLSAVAESGATRTFAHTVGNFDDRILIVGTTARGGMTVSSATYNGDALTKIRHDTVSNIRTELWYLVNPDVGTYNVVVNFSGNDDIGVVATSYFSVDSLGANTGGIGSSATTSTLSITNAQGTAIVDVLGLQAGGSGDMYTSGNQVSRSLGGGTNAQIGFSDKIGPVVNDDMKWFFDSSNFAHSAVVLVPVIVPANHRSIKRIQTTFDANSGFLQTLTLR